ncbi:MAG TPA: CoA pyrophosphatase [Ruania sp.]|nr:CoA pyrophosphatase [Ruania sp.]
MSHPVRADLIALVERARNGAFDELAGPHSYDPATASGYREAAVLALFTPTAQPTSAKAAQQDGAAQQTDLFLVQRSPLLRHHPGQIALPGGSIEAEDDDSVAAALRETQEETGIPADQVEVLGALPPVLVPISEFVVTPVLGWAPAARPEPALDTAEVLHTLRPCVDDLLDPEARATVWMAGHGSSGFRLPTGWVWGFTGNLLDHLFTQLGWTREWDEGVRHTMSWDEARGARLLGHVPSPD